MKLFAECRHVLLWLALFLTVHLYCRAVQCSVCRWGVVDRTGYLLYEHTQQKAIRWMMISYGACRTPPAVGIPQVTDPT